MKKITALLLALCLVLCGCGAAPVQTQPTTEPVVETTVPPTTVPVTEPTEPVTEPTEPPVLYFNPLNGEPMEAPFDGRIFASTVSNTYDAIPHVGVNQADIVMEMFVNGSVIRCLALYTDLSDVEAIGSTRSTRLMFNDIAQHYNAVLTHAGGSSQCLADAERRGIDNFNIDSLQRQANDLAAGTAARVRDRISPHNLFANGPGILAYVESQGIQISGLPEKDYGLRFTEDGTPAGGWDVDKLTITITYGQTIKPTIMDYDPELGKYVFNQYGQVMKDHYTGEVEAFENVIVMFTDLRTSWIYHYADFVAGGEGYYACGGKLVPINWHCDGEDQPFVFTTMDGEVLEMGIGNTYIAITSPGSKVKMEPAEG